ncbi:unnamed protein product [Rhizoctonia solani]|uniref:UBX domain-containing protein n=1 Tax=Rhizoctonia solani TaxID=456999 RepID=A0A8H3B6E3_9AGAM|nr:unnamed protein product [Rhizoctonia solani]
MSRRAKLHAYMRRFSRPFVRRIKPREEFIPEPAQPKPDTADMPLIHSTFQLPTSSSFLTTPPISPISTMSESTLLSQSQLDRVIRAEQDAAYEKAQNLDRERLEKLREERLREEELLRKRAEREEQEMIRTQQEAAYRHAQNDWRRWARRALIPTSQGRDAIEFAVRLPCGKRCIGKLPSDASMELVHIFVETLLIPPSFGPEDDPEAPPEGHEHQWGFRLVTTNPHLVLPNDTNLKICQLELMMQGALLIFEEVSDTNQQLGKASKRN